MQHRFHDARNKFSTLVPLNTHGVNSPWWFLSEFQLTMPGDSLSGATQSIHARELLQLMLQVVGARSVSVNKLQQNFWQSPCTRYCIGFHKPQLNINNLYVQKRDDYLSCCELYIDGELTVAFREPVWPHLQHRSKLRPEFLSVPKLCLDEIRQYLDKSDRENSTEAGSLDSTPIEPDEFSAMSVAS